MRQIDLEGHARFRDRVQNDDLVNRISIVVDLDAATFLVGTPGERDLEELAFHEPAVRHALRELVSALRRRAYRRRPITPVPKPRAVPCELCEGRGTIRNPFSGEVFRCPGCSGKMMGYHDLQ